MYAKRTETKNKLSQRPKQKIKKVKIKRLLRVQLNLAKISK